MASIQKRTASILNTTFIIVHSLTICAFLLRRQFHFAAETGLSLSSYVVFVFVESKLRFLLENYLRLLVIMSAVFNNFVGEYLGLYYSTDFFDKFLHMFGTFAFALAAYSVINKVVSITPLSKAFAFILVVSLGALMGIGIELLEFLSDVFLKTYNQFGLWDTNIDMLFDMFGAVLAATFAVSSKEGILRTES